MGVFAFAAGVNTASITHQREIGWLTHRLGGRAWHAHLALIAPGWAAFFLFLAGLDREVRWPLPTRLRPVGYGLLAASAGLWLAAFSQLGPERTANGYFFGRGPREAVTGGIYRWRRNPMYDSYALAFAASALARANAVYLLLAAESVLLLNLLEARVENRPFSPTSPQSSTTARSPVRLF